MQWCNDNKTIKSNGMARRNTKLFFITSVIWTYWSWYNWKGQLPVWVWKSKYVRTECVEVPDYCNRPEDGAAWPHSVLYTYDLPYSFRLCNPGEQGISYNQYQTISHERIERKKKSNTPVIFINLQEARARRDYIIDTFQSDFNNLIHLPAIRGNNSLVKALKLTTKTKVKDVILAVLFSHLHAIKRADLETRKNGTPPYALILEDDAEPSFRPFWKGKTIDSFVELLPDGWQVIQLGSTRLQENPWPIPIYDKILYEKGASQPFVKSHEWGAFAYLVSAEGMKTILEIDMVALEKVCKSLTADDCLLGFSPGDNSRSPFPVDHQYTAVPALFGIHHHHGYTGHRRSKVKTWHSLAASSGQCTSLYENVIKYNNLTPFFRK